MKDFSRFLVDLWCNPSAKRQHHDNTNDETTKQRSDERGNDKTTPPFGKSSLMRGGMRACALNPPHPVRGAGRAEQDPRSCKLQSLSRPRTLRRYSSKIACWRPSGPKFPDFSDFRSLFSGSNFHENFAFFQTLPESSLNGSLSPPWPPQVAFL